MTFVKESNIPKIWFQSTAISLFALFCVSATVLSEKAYADPTPSIFGEFIPGSIDPQDSTFKTGMGWGGGVFWDVFVNSFLFFRGGIKAENFVDPGIFLFPATIGLGARLTQGSPGDLYILADVGFAPSFYPGGASVTAYYDGGLGYSFKRLFFEAKVSVVPNANFVGGTLLYFPLTVGIHIF